jgi:predicted transcriptional regulator
MPDKQPTSFRLSPEALSLIRELAEKLGVSQAAVLEMAVRKMAKEER